MEGEVIMSNENLSLAQGVPDYHNSVTFQRLWDTLGSKLIEAAQGHLIFNQSVTGSRPARPTKAGGRPF